jgi:hypothetical protein
VDFAEATRLTTLRLELLDRDPEDLDALWRAPRPLWTLEGA